MRRPTFSLLALCLAVVILAGCTPSSVSDEPIPTGALAEEELQTLLGSDQAQLLSQIDVGENYILVESSYGSSANQFSLYDRTSGSLETIPTLPVYVELKEVVSPDEILLTTDGTNSESVIREVPALLRCLRTSSGFQVVREPLTYALDEAAELGSWNESAQYTLAAASVTLSGLELITRMDPAPDAEDLPPVEISSQEGELRVTIRHCTPGEGVTLVGEPSPFSPYCSGAHMDTDGDSIVLVLTLTGAAEGYILEKTACPGGGTLLSLTFTS